MASRSFSSAAQDMSTSDSSGSGAMAQPVDATECSREHTYWSASENSSESSVGGIWGIERMDLDESQQAEVPGTENILLLVRTTQSMGDDLEKEMKFQQSRLVSAEEENLIAHPVNMEKALGISTQLSVLMKVMEARIKDTQLRNETELHEASMARKEAERAETEAKAQMEMLKSEHGQTLFSMQSEYKDRQQALEAGLAAEKIKSAAMEQRLKEVECLLLAKSDVNAELEANVQNMASRLKDLGIVKSIAEKRLLGELKRRKTAVKAALASAKADLSRKADSFRKTYLNSALDILKQQYPNLDFSVIENGDQLGTDKIDSLDPQPSRIAPNSVEETATESKPECVGIQRKRKGIQSLGSGSLCQKYRNALQ